MTLMIIHTALKATGAAILMNIIRSRKKTLGEAVLIIGIGILTHNNHTRGGYNDVKAHRRTRVGHGTGKFTAAELNRIGKLVIAVMMKKHVEEAINATISESKEKDQAATDQAATDQAATDQAATDQAATDQAATDQAATDQAATDEIDDPPVGDIQIFDKYLLGDMVRFNSKLYNAEMIGTVVGQAGTKVRVQTYINGHNTVLHIPQKQIIDIVNRVVRSAAAEG